MLKWFKFYLILIIFVFILVGCNKNALMRTDKSDEIKMQSNDSIKLQMENDNFTFHSFDKDKECIEELSKVLDENYNDITKKLGVSLKDKVNVIIYPNIKALHNNIGMANAPDWVVGSAWGNVISMVSPLNPGSQHTYNSLMQVIVHEFVHVVQFNINPQHYYYAIKWLGEGLATYEAKQVPEKRIIKTYIDANKIPSLSDLNSKDFAEIGGYGFSYTVVEYLVKEYGYETIVSMTKEPKNIEEILGKSLDEFENDWINYLKENW